MYYDTTVFFLILVNGVPNGPIVPSWGLRQGDPLSSYLYLLCTEGLVSLLNRAAFNQSLIGIKVCRRAPQLNHLLFVDDSLVFYKADRESLLSLLEVLSTYAKASRQRINSAKTTMIFSGNFWGSTREEIMSI